jgi:hypothetical protein
MDYNESMAGKRQSGAAESLWMQFEGSSNFLRRMGSSVSKDAKNGEGIPMREHVTDWI